MALGNPFLATYAEDELIRTYEYVSGVFVPLGVSSAFPHDPPPVAISVGNVEPVFQWTQNDSYLLFMFSLSQTQNGYRTFDPSANLIGTLDGSDASQASGGYLAYTRDNDTVLQRYATTIHANAVNFKVDNVGDISTGALPVLVAYDTNTDLSVSPNGNIFTVCGVTGNARAIERTSAPGVYPPIYGTIFDVVLQFAPEIIRWAGDNATVIALSRNERVGQVYSYDSGSGDFTKIHDLQLIDDTGASVHKAEMSPDGRVLAVSFVNGSTYTTQLYRRTSGYMVPLQELAAFGKDLAWAADGKILLDVTVLKARLMGDDGTFTDHDSAMASVATDLIIGKMSLAPTDKVANPLVYLAALEPFATCGIDWNNIKFTLLTNSASFDEDDATISDVTNSGAWEVVDAAWPAGGLPVENVADGMGTGTYNFTCDPLVWLTFGSSMTWRYGVLYDATSNIPLVCFDYYGERMVSSNREVHFDFPDNVFLRLTR